jgi:HTH-type transcriptional regulator / antitoxin HigA
MTELKYTIIKNKTQYKDYSNKLEELVFANVKSKAVKDEIDLLTLLIEKWDAEHNHFNQVDPVTLLKSFMEEQNMKATGLVKLLGVSKGYVSEILNYKKGMSKDVIRKLAGHFKVSYEAFNRVYKLNTINNSLLKGVTRKHKKMAEV